MLLDTNDGAERVRIPATSYIAFGDATAEDEIRRDSGDSEFQILTLDQGTTSDSIRISPQDTTTPGSIYLGVDDTGSTGATDIALNALDQIRQQADGTTVDAIDFYSPNGGIDLDAGKGITIDAVDASNFSVSRTDNTKSSLVLEAENTGGGSTGDVEVAVNATTVGSGTASITLNADDKLELNTDAVVGNSTAVSAGAHAVGTVLCIDINGKLAPSDANAGGRKYTVGISRNATTAADQAVDLQSVHGTVCTVKTDISGLNNGQVVYLSTTAGDVTGTAPSASGDVVYRVGHIINKGTGAGDGKIVFMPQYITTIA